MKKTRKYENDSDEYLHPFWLGLLMLFTVTAVIGAICFLRKKCGSRIRALCNYIRCRDEAYIKAHPKIRGHSLFANAYNWQPTYIPPSNISPKLYKLVRNARLTSVDIQAPNLHLDDQEDSLENDNDSIIDESDFVKPPIVKPNPTHNVETARRFYASMRYTSDYRGSRSMDSTNTEASISHPTHIRSKKNSIKRGIELFRTPDFFQSITDP